jgi:hypothetical protein
MEQAVVERLETLVIVGECYGDDECDAFCPLCGFRASTYSGDFETDYYVHLNCLLWCPIHCEVLLCFTRNGGGDYDLSRILCGLKPLNPCITELSPDEAASFSSDRGFVLQREALEGRRARRPAGDDPERYFRVGILRVSHLGRFTDECDGADEGLDPKADETAIIWRALPEPVRCFAEISSEFDTSHDGNFLHYKAQCGSCGKGCTSYIWGD